MSNLLLSVQDFFCERDDRVLFQKLFFDLAAGDILQLTGPNGAGKTSLLRGLAGLSSYAQGNIQWCGQDIKQDLQGFRADTLYMGHQPSVKLLLTPVENLSWYSSLYSRCSREDIFQALDRVGLYGYETLPCHNLSAGQQRRVAIARMLLSRARLWVLDEPFTAIDKHGVAELEQFLQEHGQAGGAVLLTTHHQLQINGLKQLNLEAFQ